MLQPPRNPETRVIIIKKILMKKAHRHLPLSPRRRLPFSRVIRDRTANKLMSLNCSESNVSKSHLLGSGKCPGSEVSGNNGVTPCNGEGSNESSGLSNNTEFQEVINGKLQGSLTSHQQKLSARKKRSTSSFAEISRVGKRASVKTRDTGGLSEATISTSASAASKSKKSVLKLSDAGMKAVKELHLEELLQKQRSKDRTHGKRPVTSQSKEVLYIMLKYSVEVLSEIFLLYPKI